MKKLGHPFIKDYMMTAGPTPLPPEVVQAMDRPLPYHRSTDFVDLYARVLERLKSVFQTESDVMVFAASGTGGMESAVANLIAPGDRALTASAGKFGERWAEILGAYRATFEHLTFEWGSKLDPAAVGKALADSPEAVKAVFVTQSETSTGVINDVKALADQAHAHGALLVVDAISGLGVVDLPMDAWGIDVVVSGSQKALMCPPGLAFVAARDSALAEIDDAGSSYYFNWDRTLKAQRKPAPDSPFTPAITLLAGLDAALSRIESETLPGVFARHAILGRAARAGVVALGLDLLPEESETSNVVTVAVLPEGVDGAKVAKAMKETYGVTPAGGQGALKGRIVRIGHCGYFGAADVTTAIATLELALVDAGMDVEIGAGVAAVQRAFAEAVFSTGNLT